MDVTGSCGCGAVMFEVHGEPIAQLYCHCRSCQIAHAAPVSALVVFAAGSVRYRGPTRRVRVTRREDAAWRVVCTHCGTKVVNELGHGMRAVLPALCGAASWFAPQMHVQWQDAVMQVHDDLPKFLDYPAELGGTGKVA